jgi:tRNA/tmRNA/rRNA uracil-C5-methylase (TrmA/RlmC/RlmD family)
MHMHIPSLYIEKGAFGGFGLGFHNGKAVFVWGAIPGEIVEIEIERYYSSHAFAKIIHIVQPSPHRIAPACPNFGYCGGCDYLHVEYEEELRIKKEIIIDALTRIGKLSIESIQEIETRSSNRFGYRSHAEVKYSSDGKAGFYRKESNEVVPFPERGCLLLADALNDGMTSITNNASRQCKTAIDAEDLFHSSLEKNPVLIERENDITFQHSINCFFQANRFLRSQMAEIVCRYAHLASSEKFIDAACGVGFFALHLARNAKKGIGFDISKESIQWARYNAQINNITNVEFHTANFSSLPITDDNWDIVVVDPPRAGLSKKARHTINFISPKRIIYVSCNPATFARDAKDFISEGYIFSRLTFIDMFPGTKHIEMIGLFELLRQ